jgi:hypothetical protein
MLLQARLSWDMPRDLPPGPSKWDRHLAGRWLRDLAERSPLARAIRRLVFRKRKRKRKPDDSENA